MDQWKWTAFLDAVYRRRSMVVQTLSCVCQSSSMPSCRTNRQDRMFAHAKVHQPLDPDDSLRQHCLLPLRLHLCHLFWWIVELCSIALISCGRITLVDKSISCGLLIQLHPYHASRVRRSHCFPYHRMLDPPTIKPLIDHHPEGLPSLGPLSSHIYLVAEAGSDGVVFLCIPPVEVLHRDTTFNTSASISPESRRIST